MKGTRLQRIELTHTALVLHDMQNDFLKDRHSRPEMIEAVGKTKPLLDLAHSLPIPVIYTRVETDPAMGPPSDRAPFFDREGPAICVKGTPGAEIIDELRPGPNDHIVTKVRYSAFYGTRMEALLRTNGVWILVVAGGSTNWGVEWLARDARARDMVPVVLRDCTYSATAEAQAASLANIDDFIGYVINAAEALDLLAKAPTT